MKFSPHQHQRDKDAVKKHIMSIDEAEQIILEVRRHPFGAALIELATGVAIVVAMIGLYVAIETDVLGIGWPVYVTVFSSLAVLFGILGYIIRYVYYQNELIITNENIIQILQFSPFNRQVSQLNLAKIQDVSVDQIGLSASLFGYGTIEIETAGEKSNFRFTFVDNPNQVAKVIIEAHEDFIRRTGAGDQGF